MVINTCPKPVRRHHRSSRKFRRSRCKLITAGWASIPGRIHPEPALNRRPSTDDRPMKDDFYIGWEKHAPPGIGRLIRRIVLALLLLAVLVAAGLAVSQRLIGSSVFEYGEVKKF